MSEMLPIQLPEGAGIVVSGSWSPRARPRQEPLWPGADGPLHIRNKAFVSIIR
jgi:hypothetical protein